MRNVLNHLTHRFPTVRGIVARWIRTRTCTVGYVRIGSIIVGSSLAILLCLVVSVSRSISVQANVAQVNIVQSNPAQSEPETRDCSELIDIMRLVTSEQMCRSLNNNWACYGNAPAQAVPAEVRFSRPRDRARIADFDTVYTQAPDGVVLMRLLTATDPMNVVFFGDMAINNAGEQGFILRRESGNLVCQNTPAGLVARTEKGKIGNLTVNGVEIELGSTVFATLSGETSMAVTNLEGNVTVAIPELNLRQRIAPGEQVLISLMNNAPVSMSEPRPAPEAASPLLQWLGSDESSLAQVSDSAVAEPTPTVPPTVPPTATAQPANDSDDDQADAPVPSPTRRVLQRTPLPWATIRAVLRPTPTPTPTPTPDEKSGPFDPPRHETFRNRIQERY